MSPRKENHCPDNALNAYIGDGCLAREFATRFSYHTQLFLYARDNVYYGVAVVPDDMNTASTKLLAQAAVQQLAKPSVVYWYNANKQVGELTISDEHVKQDLCRLVAPRGCNPNDTEAFATEDGDAKIARECISRAARVADMPQAKIESYTIYFNSVRDVLSGNMHFVEKTADGCRQTDPTVDPLVARLCTALQANYNKT